MMMEINFWSRLLIQLPEEDSDNDEMPNISAPQTLAVNEQHNELETMPTPTLILNETFKEVLYSR